MNKSQLNAIVAAVVAAMSVQPKASKHVKQSSYKPKNNFTPKGKILSEGKTERQLKNDVNVAKAFAKQGITVTPRVDALNYNGWLSKGMRVVPGQHGTFVKSVGTLFHSGQVAADDKMSKSDMTAEAAKLLASAQGLNQVSA